MGIPFSKRAWQAWVAALGVLCSCELRKPTEGARQVYGVEHVAGAWFGFAQADLYLYRVELTPPELGRGACFSSLSESVSKFTIRKWELNVPNKLRIEIEPGSTLSRIEGDLITEGMFVGSVYGSTGWSNSVEFYKEGRFDARLSKLRKAMAKPAAHGP